MLEMGRHGRLRETKAADGRRFDALFYAGKNGCPVQQVSATRVNIRWLWVSYGFAAQITSLVVQLMKGPLAVSQK
jgi:hypothetical protein